MRIAARLTLAQLALASMLAIVVLVALRAVDRMSHQLETGVNRQMPLARALDDAKVAAREIAQHATIGLDYYAIAARLDDKDATGVRLKALGVIQQTQAQLLQYQQELDTRLSVAAEIAAQHFSNETPLLAKTRQAADGLHIALGQYLGPVDGNLDTRTLALGRLNTAVRNFAVAVDGWLAFERTEFDENTGMVLATANEATRNILLFTGLALLAALAVGWRVSRSVSRPIRALTAALQDTAGGKRGKVAIAGSGEVRVLADTYNDMVDELARTTVTKAYVDRIIESLPDALVVLDAQCHIRSANEAALAQLGWARADLSGQPITAILKEPCWDVCATKASPGRIDHRDMRILTRTGEVIDVSMSATALVAGVGAGEEIVVCWQDIRERLSMVRSLEAAKAAAEVAARAKAEFLATMSHEIRTPMHGVLGMTELMLNDELSPRQRTRAEKVRRSGQHLLAILNDILDFSKIEAGRLEMEDAPFDLRRETEKVLQMLRPQIEAKGLALLFEWPDALPGNVIGDPTRYAQIVTNLIGNAAKFTSEGHVRFGAKLLEERGERLMLRFEVEDTGIGIKEEVLPQLFQTFVQADSSTTRRFGGTGLGLAIVRRLCQLMGGECGATSRYGEGSCFWFTLALQRNASVSADALEPVEFLETQPLRPATLDRPLRVLVVEDNPVNQMVARGFLDALGCACMLADNGLQAVNILTAPHDYDIVLMDCQMPELDGLEATRQVRAHEAGGSARIPIVALTANAMVGDRESCLQAGMDDFLSKPFQREELKRVLDRWGATIATGDALTAA